jgi:hypothetical protein
MSTLADIQSLLFAAAAGTIIMTFSVVLSMLNQSKVRYQVVDSQGKKMLSHPYKPWQNVPEEYKAGAAAAYAACRSYENSKEWLQLSLPMMWTFSLFGEALPYATHNIVSILTFALSAVWFIGNHIYLKGYTAENPDGRVTGFKIRTTVFKVWTYASMAAVACYAVRFFGLYDLP